MDLELQPREFVCPAHPCELDEPEGGITAQYGYHLVAVRGATQLLQRLQHGQVGLPVFIVLDTVAASDAYGPLGLRGKEVFNQRGLANAGLAREENELSLALLYAFVPRL